MVRQKPKIEITNLTPCPIKCNKKALNNQGFFIICSAHRGERLLYSGLVMESRGGAKGGVNERNTDYLLALEVILSRIFKLNIRTIKVFLVSKNALKIWPSMAQRALEVEGSTDIKK
jgi:hypothetical protein